MSDIVDAEGAVATDSRPADLVVRLRRIEGQIRGIMRMIEDDRTCEDVITQLLAVRSGMDRVATEIVRLHLDRCMCDLTPEQSRTEMVRLVDLFSRIS